MWKWFTGPMTVLEGVAWVATAAMPAAVFGPGSANTPVLLWALGVFAAIACGRFVIAMFWTARQP